MRMDPRNSSPILHSRPPPFGVAAIILLVPACATLQPAGTTVQPTPADQPTATFAAPPPVAIASYLSFAPVAKWSVPKTSQIRGLALSPNTKRVALVTSRYKDKRWLELRNSETGDLLWELDLNE